MVDGVWQVGLEIQKRGRSDRHWLDTREAAIDDAVAFVKSLQ
jgi:hypothetical protein